MYDAKIAYYNPQNLNEADIKKVVIWLHGLGADGSDFLPIVPMFKLPFAVKFIFPNAPSIAVTVNGGYIMPAWYDILEMGDISRKVDVAGVQASAERVAQIIKDEQARGVALKDIVLAGFSQGGAVVYHTAMSVDGLGGLIALSTYFATTDEFDGFMVDKKLPIFIGHGDYDDTVSPKFARLAINVLEQAGFSPDYRSYNTAHSINPQEIGDIGRWLAKVLA